MFDKKGTGVPEIFKKYIAPLDGLRALSILIVIFTHVIISNDAPQVLRKVDEVLKPISLGVYLFFFISGFLITGLLLKEKNTTGKISFKGFYWRRFVRIFPVFYFFLLVVFVLSRTVFTADIADGAFIRTALYVTNFSKDNVGWYLGHTWSLAVEEQYYLLWPILIVLYLRTRNMIWFVALLGYHVISNVIGYKFDLQNELLVPFFNYFPLLFSGSLLSMVLFRNEEKTIALFRRLNNTLMVPVMFVLIVTINYFPNQGKLGIIFLPFGMLMMGAALFIFFGLILFGKYELWRNIFSTSVLRFIGKVSYSWYIWQQIFITREGLFFFGYGSKLNIFPYHMFASFIAAVISYYAVEMVFLKFKTKVK